MVMLPLPMSVALPELEGAVLQGTASVDCYLQAAAHQWTPEHLLHGDSYCHALRSLFLSDLSSASSWQNQQDGYGGSSSSSTALWVPPHSKQRRPRQHPLEAHGADEQLEHFLLDDLHHYMERRKQLDQQASNADAAVPASTAHKWQRRPSSCSSSNSSISFVRLPEDSMHDAAVDADSEQHQPVAAALAAVAAMGGLGTSPLGAAAALCQQAQHAATPAAADGVSVLGARRGTPAARQEGGSSSEQAHAQAAPAQPFVMQPEVEIAAQKRAARARLAELERGCSTQTAKHDVHAAAEGSRAKACDDWATDGAAASSMHDSKVPQRPRGFAAVPPAKKQPCSVPCKLVLRELASKLRTFSTGGSEGVLLQHRQFLQHMVAGLALCMLLMPVLWLLQAEDSSSSTSSILGGVLPAALLAKAQQLGNALCICGAASIVVYLLAQSLQLQPRLLHFRESALEQQFFLWSNAGRLFQDCLFQMTFMAVGSCMWLRLLPLSTSAAGAAQGAAAALASTGQLVLFAAALAGSALHVGLVLLARGARQVQWREWLLSGNRLLSVLALVLTQLSCPQGPLQLSMPLIASAQVMGIACMQVRLSSFVVTQLLQLLVLLPVCARAASPLLHIAQLFGGWVCLPCLVLYCMELQSRKAFLLALAPGQQQAAAKVAP